MDDVDRDDGAGVDIGLWRDVLDLVESVSHRFELSGWSLGAPVDGGLNTFTRGFSADTCAAFARLDLDVDLPGPVTFATGRDQFFPTRDEAHRLYPLTAGILGGTEHDAAAVLALRASSEVVRGFLALHFPTPRSFDVAEQERLGRLADSIAVALPVPRVAGLPSARAGAVRVR